jgi:protein gp37
MAKRLTKTYPRGFEPHFRPERLDQPMKRKKPAKIFTCSMGELFGNWVPRIWIHQILDVIELCPQHTFQILTKCPLNTLQWIFTNNIWLGYTVDKMRMSLYNTVFRNVQALKDSDARIKFISFEPLLEDCSEIDLEGIDWIIIGAQTNPYKKPKYQWVSNLIRNADDLNIPVFLKENLQLCYRRQEFPT